MENSELQIMQIKLGSSFQRKNFEIIWGVFEEKYSLILIEKIGDKFESKPMSTQEAIIFINKNV
jgi:hypothetical protein